MGKGNFTNEIKYNNQGLKMWIKSYRKYRDIDVEFEDGYISYNKQYTAFKNGGILNKNFKNTRTNNPIGEINYNRYGSKMTIVEYNNNSDIIVEFDNGWKTKSAYKEFNNGHIKNPYDKSIYNRGYLGEGIYIASINKKHTKRYAVWKSMFVRCYSENFHKTEPTYIGCSVCDEWLNFQNFGKWFDENYYDIEGEIIEIDKDILVKGNKVYSPNTCCFVPKEINMLFTKRDSKRGNYPIGVYYNKKRNKYIAQCKIYKDNRYIKFNLGEYDTSEQAFDTYKLYKEKYIKEVANRYKDKIPVKLYSAMYNWKVDIND